MFEQVQRCAASRGHSAFLGALLLGFAVDAAWADGIAGGWSAEIGGGVRVHPSHLGSSRYTVDGEPIVQLQIGRDFSASLDDGVKWAALRAGPLAFGPVVEYRQSFGDRASRGAVRRTDAVEIGGFTSLDLGIGVAEARLRKAVTGYQGWSGDLSFDTGMPITPTLRIGAELRGAWASSAFSHDYFRFGALWVGDRDRLGFQRNDFYSTGLELDLQKDVTAHIRLGMSLSYDRILGAEWHSPMLQTRNVGVAGLGLTYRFGAGGQ